jgi:pilus assembly protein CpaD
MRREETTMQIVIVRTTIAERIAGRIVKSRRVTALALRAAVIGGCAMVVCACTTDQQQVAAVPDVPYDYRQRHPITITEVTQTLEVFVGTSRGELNASQRAEVAQFGHSWRREATGGVAVELPVGSSNERAAADSMHMIRSILAAVGVPPDGIVVRGYQAPGHNIAPIRVSYPRIAGQAGPCGLWPEDIGPSYTRDYFENQPVWNHGCATQRNLAAMVDNPADLVQPRGETPAFQGRRTVVIESYRAGAPTGTTPDTTANQAKISDLGKNQ